MAKLYFRHGAVGSAKTLNLLAVAHNYRQQNKKVLILKPEIDTRFGKNLVKSRAGISAEADVLIANPFQKISEEQLKDVACILVDEIQFVEADCIDYFRELSISHRIPIICYGLRTDFRRKLFHATKRLLELADSIEEVKTTCSYCNKKAIFNLKLVDGKPTLDGPIVELGTEEKYLPTCADCYQGQI